jgi:TrmH family RNA methyltransferase
MRIDSPTNPRIKAALRAVENGERVLLEGPRAIGEALASGIVPREIFLEGEDARGKGYGPAIEEGAARGAKVVLVSPKVLRKLSDLPSARGAVALAIPPRRSLTDLHFHGKPPAASLSPSRSPLAASPSPSSLVSLPLSSSSSSSLFVLLDGVQDPANVGAIVRSADAFGAAGVLLTPDCASPFSPKAVRASALSALRVPLATGVMPKDAAAWAARHGAALAGAEAHGGGPPDALAKVRPLVLVIGSEGRGISPDLERNLTTRVTLRLADRVESLNAAVAAGLLLYLATRREV